MSKRRVLAAMVALVALASVTAALALNRDQGRRAAGRHVARARTRALERMRGGVPHSSRHMTAGPAGTVQGVALFLAI